MKKLIILMIAFIVHSTVTGYDLTDLQIENRNENSYFYLSPTISTGSHVNGIGLYGASGFLLKTKAWDTEICHDLGIILSPMAYERSYGMPGPSFELYAGLRYGFSWGEKYFDTNTKWRMGYDLSHTFDYRLGYYLASDGTSQMYGGFSYVYTDDGSRFELAVDNDDYQPQVPFGRQFWTDKYRTAKIAIKYVSFNEVNLLGAGINVNLWTGDTSGAVLNPTGNGGGYSNGVAALSLFYNSFELSIGYDSEEIRDFVQNGFHWLIGVGRVPLLERDGRLFVSLRIFPHRDIF